MNYLNNFKQAAQNTMKAFGKHAKNTVSDTIDSARGKKVKERKADFGQFMKAWSTF